ncbi:carbohydrate ABC transporter permease [Paenibacillus marinisediminis]
MNKSFFRRNRKTFVGLLFISPWVLGFMLFMAYPMIYSLFMSFNKVYITTDGIETEALGWGNYQYAFLTDPKFIEVLVGFLKEVVVMVPIVIVFSLFVALLINQPIKFKGFFRAIFFLPVVITSGQVINELFNQGATTIPLVERYGVVELVQNNLSPALAGPLIAIIEQFILILWFSGVQILIFLAGLQKVNTQVYEAAQIDGASPWEIFWKITLPEIKPFILVNIIYTIVDLFTNSMNEVITLIKDQMFQVDTGFGYASALAWIYFAIIFVVLLLVMLVLGRNENYSIKSVRKVRR